MKLESQVCSLELSKKLRELGVKQESLFYWTVTMPDPTGETWSYDLAYVDTYYIQSPGDIEASAFTVAELGEMLPQPCISLVMENWLNNPESKYKCYDSTVENWFMVDRKVYASTEADARAKMLIYLIENNLITL
jgi:hypothetical protein